MATVRGRPRPTPLATPLAQLRARLDALLAGQAWWWGLFEPDIARQSFAFHLDHLFGEAAREQADVDPTADPCTR